MKQRSKSIHAYTRAAVNLVLEMEAISEAELFSRSRTVAVSMARAYVWLILRHFHKWTLARIGGEFDRHHGAVLCALKKLNDLYETDPHYRARITHVLQRAIKNAQVKHA